MTACVDASRLDRAQLLHIEGPLNVRHVRARRSDKGVVAITGVRRYVLAIVMGPKLSRQSKRWKESYVSCDGKIDGDQALEKI